jgi:thymidylate synthase (FAD)
MSQVRTVCVSKPVIDGMTTPSELLAFCARVSATANQDNHATGPKLIRSLIKRSEWSPLEMASMTMEITTTRDIARQILRHRSFSFQEFSQRYAKVTDPAVLREARNQHPTDRQASVEIDDPSVQDDWRRAQQRVWDVANHEYNRALERGMAKEVARSVLPEGLAVSRLYMAGTIRSWFHYCHLRMDSKTQKEHRLIALQCWECVLEYFVDLGAES